MKQLLFIPVMLMSIAASALPNGWVVTVFNQAYNNLSSPTVVPLAPGWDDPDVTIPLGFNYTIWGKTTDTVYIDGSNISSGTEVTTSLNGAVAMFSTGLDIMDRATYPTNPASTISYITEGVPGNKIAKLQWFNFGFYGEDDVAGTLNDSANIQLWLYEADGSCEFRFGPSYLDDFERNVEGTKFPIGVANNLDVLNATLDWFYFLSALSPVTVDSFNFSNPPLTDIGINTYPVDGTVIRFGPAINVGVQNKIKLNEELTFYPNEVTGMANLDFTNPVNGNAIVRVLDMNGRVLSQQKVIAQQNKIDLSNLANSNYLLQVQYEGQSIFYKFIKN